RRSRRSARYCRAGSRGCPRRRPGRTWKTAGRSRQSNDRGEQDRKFAWHILLVERHADGPPTGPDRVICAALGGPAQSPYGVSLALVKSIQDIVIKAEFTNNPTAMAPWMRRIEPPPRTAIRR